MPNDSLDTLIRDMAARGEITHISLTPSQKGKLWRATFAPASKMGVSFAEDADPIKAITRALSSPTGLKRRPSAKPSPAGEIIDHEADPVADLM